MLGNNAHCASNKAQIYIGKTGISKSDIYLIHQHEGDIVSAAMKHKGRCILWYWTRPVRAGVVITQSFPFAMQFFPVSHAPSVLTGSSTAVCTCLVSPNLNVLRCKLWIPHPTHQQLWGEEGVIHSLIRHASMYILVQQDYTHSLGLFTNNIYLNVRGLCKRVCWCCCLK